MPNTAHRPALTPIRTLSDFTWSAPRYPGWLRLVVLFIGSGIGWAIILWFAFTLAAILHR